MKTRNFTTTLSAPVLIWLDEVAKKLNQPKNKIIELALKKWRKDFLRQQIKNSYKDASLDKEWQELGNMGIDDWSDNLKRWEK